MKFLIQSCIVFILAAAFGALAYIAYTNNYAYKQTSLDLDRLQLMTLSAPLWKYGVVESIHASESTIRIRTANGLLIDSTVSSDAYIARQELIGENGIYNSATDPVAASLADVQPGNNVAYIMNRRQNEPFIITTLLFGNPF